MEQDSEEMDKRKQESEESEKDPEESEEDSEDTVLETQESRELKEDLAELQEMISKYSEEPRTSLYGRDDLDDTKSKDPTEFFYMKQDYRHTEIRERELRKMKKQNPFPYVMTFMLSGIHEFYRSKQSKLNSEEIEPEDNPSTDPNVAETEPKVTSPKADNPHMGTNFHTPWHSLLRLTTIVSDLLSIKDRCGRGCACASCRGALHVFV